MSAIRRILAAGLLLASCLGPAAAENVAAPQVDANLGPEARTQVAGGLAPSLLAPAVNPLSIGLKSALPPAVHAPTVSNKAVMAAPAPTKTPVLPPSFIAVEKQAPPKTAAAETPETGITTLDSAERVIGGAVQSEARGEKGAVEGAVGDIYDASGKKKSAAAVDAQALPWHRRIDFARVEETLLHGEVKEAILLKDFLAARGHKNAGSHDASLVVTMTDGTRAFFKPDPNLKAAYAEKAAYDFARLLGLRLIPPTVVREIGGVPGSLQYWVESSVDKSKIKTSEFYARIPRQEFNAIQIFQFVFGQWDRHTGNLVVDDAPSAAMIDNTGIGHRQKMRYGELPYLRQLPLLKGVQAPEAADFPFDSAVPIQSVTEQSFRAFFAGKVDEKHIPGAKWNWNKKTPPNLRVVFWKGWAWIQRDIGTPPINIATLDEESLAGYRGLTYDALRRAAPASFPDEQVREFLERRDELLRETKRRGKGN